MPKRSAGLLPYRWREEWLEVFLVHPGGPFWASKDEGAWSIAKGEYEPGEDPLTVARREFEEEVGQPPPSGTAIHLGEVRLASGKLVTAFAVAGRFRGGRGAQQHVQHGVATPVGAGGRVPRGGPRRSGCASLRLASSSTPDRFGCWTTCRSSSGSLNGTDTRQCHRGTHLEHDRSPGRRPPRRVRRPTGRRCIRRARSTTMRDGACVPDPRSNVRASRSGSAVRRRGHARHCSCRPPPAPIRSISDARQAHRRRPKCR